MVARGVIAALAFGALLFGPAGTVDWPEGWVFLGLFFGCSAGLGVWLRRADSALLAERQKSALGRGQAAADRAVMGAILAAFLLWFVAMGVDARRFHWSAMPEWVEAAGAALIVGAYLGWAAVLRENTFAIAAIRLQPERGQRVIASGPYAVVRHPMYGFALLFLGGTALLLGSWAGVGFLAVFVPLLAARIRGEEAMLRRGLPGYAAYAARVRARMIPWVY